MFAGPTSHARLRAVYTPIETTCPEHLYAENEETEKVGVSMKLRDHLIDGRPPTGAFARNLQAGDPCPKLASTHPPPPSASFHVDCRSLHSTFGHHTHILPFDLLHPTMRAATAQ